MPTISEQRSSRREAVPPQVDVRLPDEGTAHDAYDEALRVCGREAAATLAAALGLCIFFWAAIALLKDSPERFWGLPLWFLVSVFGGYVLSVAVVVLIVKRFFRSVPLDLKRTVPAAKNEDLNSKECSR